MDAVEYLKTKRKMCETFQSCCINCPLKGDCGMPTDPEENVKAVEEWAKEHPVKTRQSEFLKMFPSAHVSIGLLNIRPCDVDIKVHKGCADFSSCWTCRREYWTEEIK